MKDTCTCIRLFRIRHWKRNEFLKERFFKAVLRIRKGNYKKLPGRLSN